MTRKTAKRTSPVAETIDPAMFLAFAAPDAPVFDFDAFQSRDQRRCCDCGGAVEHERDGKQCALCAEREAEQSARLDTAYRKGAAFAASGGNWAACRVSCTPEGRACSAGYDDYVRCEVALRAFLCGEIAVQYAA